MKNSNLAQNLYDTYTSILSELGYDNWEALCAGEGLTTLDKQINWFVEDIDPSMEGHISNDESYTLAGELSCLFGLDDRFDGLADEITDAIAIAYIDTDDQAWMKDYKLEVLKDGLEEYNAENEEKITLAESISLDSDSDPNFFFWLFDSNRALVDDNGHLTKKGKEIYADFIACL